MPKSSFLSIASLVFLALSLLVRGQTNDAPAFLQWAQTLPMGWNSWDAFATTITEDQAKAETDYMAGHLLSHGWQYLVVDIQ
jgi:hypothetical protein